ncbi:DNA polymerase III subunit gamma/tau [Lacticaseibacillus zeae]|uniref:DNA-directed DNA polymerase n=1 Tax=Lacticaseibacillus zeae subsp. silagei TaxID=3068307 RepID=A0ABD7ZEK2_LACZE|nr:MULTISPECIES: DNA polymerase III subunit gamma/tau [Lacticaseibacillus]MDE3315934.1 DNA polymerase III subunit gamma/tau [Lacticaseibacillus zeae]OFR94653.1 DNA polymerase III subunit gamma/tau [Lactobacillus sp. HMSC068F07]WLV85050.1 DNA polymerase III subunit gamma/tau [Lacticaseibacillus sp. NCIMB 15475]WLV87773.1 DNA polymerase III subunit gamma/tau [Lacticaseibacillus sp. NCIMB 15474]
MSYQALYRVWRPQQFKDVIGQDAITKTLKNALITGQTSHAYLFTGPRGTGKTSVAKILAKALNCLNLKDGEPDNTCEICQAINDGSLTDVIEIDAASNNGVDEIRDIRDKAKYAPTRARVKVYIIDEVHMLSSGAFNALLKTLEEPPAHVVFILATTEPHKIPATIISRTQRFDFRRITPEDIVKRMRFILDDKKITYDDAALKVIAKAAEGGMRDALSILDQVLSFGDNHVTTEDALDVTGGVTTAVLGKYLAAVLAKDHAQALKMIEDLLAAGKDAGRLIEDLIEYLRDLLVNQQASSLLGDLEKSLLDDQFKILSENFKPAQIYHMIDVLNNTQQQLRMTNHPEIYLEVATVRLSETAAPAAAPVAAEPADTQKLDQLSAKVKQLSDQLKRVEANGGTVPPPTRTRKHVKAKASHVNRKAIYPILGAATKQDLTNLKDVWPDLLGMLSITKRAMMKVSEPVAASPDGVIVSFDYDILVERAMNDAALMTELENGLQKLTGKQPKIVLVQSDVWPTIRKDYIQELKAPATKGKSADTKPKTPPVVNKMTELFGKDAPNVTIKND